MDRRLINDNEYRLGAGSVSDLVRPLFPGYQTGCFKEAFTARDTLGCEGDQTMAFLQEFRCEICGTVSSNPIHWFVIQCGSSQLTVLQWDLDTANAPGARHYCGEAHAQVYISRWFQAACTRPLPDFKTSGASRQS